MARQSSAAAARPAWPDRQDVAKRRERRQPGRAVKPQGAGRPRGIARLTATVAIVAAVLLVLGIRQAGITAVGYEIDATKRQLAGAKGELERLEAELARLAAPERVEDGALAMGMTDAAEVRLAAVGQLVAEPVEVAAGQSAVVKLSPVSSPDVEVAAAQGGGAPEGKATDSRTLAGAVGDFLRGWLGGGRAEAETLH